MAGDGAHERTLDRAGWAASRAELVAWSDREYRAIGPATVHTSERWTAPVTGQKGGVRGSERPRVQSTPGPPAHDLLKSGAAHPISAVGPAERNKCAWPSSCDVPVRSQGRVCGGNLRKGLFVSVARVGITVELLSGHVAFRPLRGRPSQEACRAADGGADLSARNGGLRDLRLLGVRGLDILLLPLPLGRRGRLTGNKVGRILCWAVRMYHKQDLCKSGKVRNKYKSANMCSMCCCWCLGE